MTEEPIEGDIITRDRAGKGDVAFYESNGVIREAKKTIPLSIDRLFHIGLIDGMQRHYGVRFTTLRHIALTEIGYRTSPAYAMAFNPPDAEAQVAAQERESEEFDGESEWSKAWKLLNRSSRIIVKCFCEDNESEDRPDVIRTLVRQHESYPGAISAAFEALGEALMRAHDEVQKELEKEI